MGVQRCSLPRGLTLRAQRPSHVLVSHPLAGDVEKAVTELIIDFDVNPEEESPYEALYNATSCHSLDSLASGRSSDRESVNKDVESAALKAAAVRPVRSCFLRTGTLGRAGACPSSLACSQNPVVLPASNRFHGPGFHLVLNPGACEFGVVRTWH